MIVNNSAKKWIRIIRPGNLLPCPLAVGRERGGEIVFKNYALE